MTTTDDVAHATDGAGQEVELQPVQCDDCQGPVRMVIFDLATRENDYLCWPCLIKRAAAVGGAITAAG